MILVAGKIGVRENFTFLIFLYWNDVSYYISPVTKHAIVNKEPCSELPINMRQVTCK